MHGREVKGAACEKSQFFLGNSVTAVSVARTKLSFLIVGQAVIS